MHACIEETEKNTAASPTKYYPDNIGDRDSV